MARPLLHPIQRMIPWLRRMGPLRSLALALIGSNLLFFGCVEWGQIHGLATKPDQPVPAHEIDREIRVRLLGRTPRNNVQITIMSPFSVTNAATGAVLLPDQPPAEDVYVRPSGESGIQIGPKIIPAVDIFITPTRDASVVVNGQTYRGRLRVQRAASGLVMINHVDMESYLRGVLRGELPRNFQPESFKAQCVAARTYALYQKQFNAADRFFDVYDDEGSQMYMGVRGEDGVADRAVRDTTGEVCEYYDGHQSRLFCTYYSSTCGGLSQPVHNCKPNDPDVPPLSGNVECNDCKDAKFYRWPTVTITRAELTKKLTARYPNLRRLGTITDLTPRSKTSDGRIIKIEVAGSGGRDTLLGEDFRLAIGGRVLKSTNFDIEKTRDGFAFKNGRGFGHGMGLCQYGMDAKAKRGMNYREILQTYYPTALIKKLY
ncbi:MAG TPA: SpoIID/LytB domain-containing protein [Phycisphaerae bacterium]|nr:SpoIID/LytB domain-containing protein [Phycisphaerae bacterium]